LGSPVWSEAHAARAGFDQSSPRFAGHLPAHREGLRAALADHDLVLLVGGPAFRQYLWAEGPFVTPGTTVVVVTEDAEEASFSAADLAVVGPLTALADALADRLSRRDPQPVERAAVVVPPVPAADEPIAPAHVFAALAERLPAESTLIEESPSTRSLLVDMVPARTPLGFLTPAMGGLGFALAAATGVKLALPERPVVAVVGDGASLYNIQTLWSAAHYDVGALFVIMSNGGYAVMDRLALNAGGKPPWPSFEEISVSTIAAGFGCPTRRIETHDDLLATLDEVIPHLASRREPLLLDVAVSS
jgi:benzoylformate decarboxylase